MSKKLFLFFILFFLLAGNNCLAAVNIEFPLPGLPASPSLPQYILYFFQLGIALGGVLAVLSLVFSGIQFIYSSGNPEGMGEAKKRASSAILGLILLLSSFILITTINPKLKNLDYTEGLRPAGQLFFVKGTGGALKPASMSLENLDAIKKEYDEILWKETIMDTTGRSINNCDPEDPNAVYVIYWYKDYNFKNLSGATRLKCGQHMELVGANSYKIIKETPGVYFYDGPNCFPKVGSANVPVPRTTSVPEDIGMGATVHSIRIVNGPDPKKGPFYGVIYLNSTDYRTGESSYGFQHFLFETNLSQYNIEDDNSRCFSGKQIGYGNLGNVPSKGVSWVIYKWVGFKEDGITPNASGAGNGVTLFSEVSWGGGHDDINLISAASWTSWLQIDLRTRPVDYSNTSVATERHDVCKFFNPRYSCLQSFEIKGDYLVLVLSNIDYPYKYSQSTRAQAFPMSSRLQEAYVNQKQGFSIERGTPKITSDYIGSKSAYYMEIIPLAERLK